MLNFEVGLVQGASYDKDWKILDRKSDMDCTREIILNVLTRPM
jgi:hypothetical protein